MWGATMRRLGCGSVDVERWFAKIDPPATKLAAARPPWMLYSVLLLVIAAGAWKAIDVAATPPDTVLLPFQLAAARDDLASLRMAWMNRTYGKGVGPNEAADLQNALKIANRHGYGDIVDQLHRWGIHEDCLVPIPRPA